MLKNNNLALFTLIIVGLVSSLTTNIFAQKVEISQTKPSVTITDTDIWQKYIEVSSLPIGKRPKVFSDLSKEMKANLFRFHLASQFVKRPNLTKVQKDFILESLSNLSADDYDSTKGGTNFESKAENLEARAKILFSDKEIFEIFANMQSDENDLI